MPVKIFFCYSHEDEELLNKLKSHLRPLQRQGLIDLWHDCDISAGAVWSKEIDHHLNTASIILLLVSPDFMNSEYCYGIEMKQALEKHERGEVRVIPIILRPVYWQETLGSLQALPTDAKPILSSRWQYLDEALFNVADGIRKVAMELFSKPVPSLSTDLQETMNGQQRKHEQDALIHVSNKANLNQQFFSDILEHFKKVRPGVTNAKKVQQPVSCWFSGGKSGFYFQWNLRENTVQTELIINVININETKRIFDSFFEQREAIEHEFGTTLDWQRRDQAKESHIVLSKPANITDSPAELEEAKKWAVNTMVQFVDVFQKRIKVLKIHGNSY